VRKIVILVFVALAAILWLGPVIAGGTDPADYADELGAALATADLNESRAQGAPQQTVVNGWVNRDLQAIQIEQRNDLLTAEHRQTALLTLLAVMLAWSFVADRSTAPAPSPAEPSSASSPS